MGTMRIKSGRASVRICGILLLILGVLALPSGCLLSVIPTNWEGRSIVIITLFFLPLPLIPIAMNLLARSGAGRQRLCPQCQYDMRGSRSLVCPECGWAAAVE